MGLTVQRAAGGAPGDILDPVTVVDTRDFSFRYGDAGPWVVRDVSVSIHAGEVVFVGGPSGSGKSTLCSAFSGQVPFKVAGQMKGTVSLFSRDVWSWTPRDLAGRIGHVLQNAEEQLVTFTVREEIAFAVENLCLPLPEITARIDAIASSLGIARLLDRSIDQLSGGEKQRVIIAANLVMQPDILILDEPLAFLDARGETALIAVLEDMRLARPDLAIIIVEHRMAPFKHLVDTVILLDTSGTVAFNGTVDEHEAWVRQQAHPRERPAPVHEPRPGDPPVIRVDGVSFSYPGGPDVFRDLHFHAFKGEIVGIVGENGCGKTTLLHLLAGILQPSGGRISFDGRPINQLEPGELLPRIGFIFQNPENQLFEGTVRDEVLLGPSNLLPAFATWDPGTRDAIVGAQVAFINEERVPSLELAARNPFRLSWGQKRRLNIGSVLSYDPDVLMLDEPFIGQDSTSVSNILDIIHELRARGKTILLVSHDLDIVHDTCSRIVNVERPPCPAPSTLAGASPGRTGTRGRRARRGTRKRARLDDFIRRSRDDPAGAKEMMGIHPVAKMAVLVSFTLSLFFQSSLLVLGMACAFVFIVACVLERDASSFFHRIRWVVVLVLVSVPLNALFDATSRPGEEVLFFLLPPFLPVRRFALHLTLRAGITLLTMFVASVLYIRTTPVRAMVHGFTGAGLPHRLAIALMVGLRYVPLVRDEALAIEIAQRMRGVSLTRGVRPRVIFKYLFRRVATLLISLFRKIQSTACSMDARAFGAFPGRNSLFTLRFSKRDAVVVAVAVVASAFGIMFGLGLFPVLSPPSLLAIAGSVLP